MNVAFLMLNLGLVFVLYLLLHDDDQYNQNQEENTDLLK